jgi:hypothetical protein
MKRVPAFENVRHVLWWIGDQFLFVIVVVVVIVIIVGTYRVPSLRSSNC